jgi:hypothetical protein
VSRNRSRSFRHIKEGQFVTRLVAGKATQLRVTRVEQGLIHCGELTFERRLGLEVDSVLGPGVWGVVRSQLQPEPPPMDRRTVLLSTGSMRLVQIVLFAAYLTTLATIVVAINLHRYPLAVWFGVGGAMLGAAMHSASQEGRALSRTRMKARSGNKASGAP